TTSIKATWSQARELRYVRRRCHLRFAICDLRLELASIANGNSAIANSPSRLFIVHPLLAQPQLRERQHEHHDEQDPRQRAGVAHMEKLERLLEQVIRVKKR